MNELILEEEYPITYNFKFKSNIYKFKIGKRIGIFSVYRQKGLSFAKVNNCSIYFNGSRIENNSIKIFPWWNDPHITIDGIKYTDINCKTITYQPYYTLSYIELLIFGLLYIITGFNMRLLYGKIDNRIKRKNTKT